MPPKATQQDFIMKSKYVDIIFTEEQQEDINEIDKNEINRIYYFIKQTGPVKCQIIREFLQEKGLYLEDKDCGIQGKRKVNKDVAEIKKQKDQEKEKEREEKKAKKEREKEREKEFKKKEKELKKKQKKEKI